MAYGYSRSITIDHAKCGTADSTDFPMLFGGTYSWLATVANGGKVQNASGYDIIFASDAAGATPLNFERVAYSSSTGAVEFWVKISTLSHTTDTVIYVLYGDSSITTDQQTASSVWSNSFKGVYHLAASGAVSVVDSSGNGNGGISGNNGKTLPSYTSSVQFGNGGITCSGGGSEGITLASMAMASPFTISAWAYPTTSAHLGAIIGGITSGMVEFRQDTSNNVWLLKQQIAGIGGSTANMTLNAWNHVAVTYSGGGVAAMYVAGAASGGGTSSQTFTTNNYLIGGPLPNGENFIGRLDEIKISTVARSADWIATEYNNQNSPSTFYTLGSESGGSSSAQPCFFLLM